jgi:hypothetical protein
MAAVEEVKSKPFSEISTDMKPEEVETTNALVIVREIEVPGIVS